MVERSIVTLSSPVYFCSFWQQSKLSTLIPSFSFSISVSFYLFQLKFAPVVYSVHNSKSKNLIEFSDTPQIFWMQYLIIFSAVAVESLIILVLIYCATADFMFILVALCSSFDIGISINITISIMWKISHIVSRVYHSAVFVQHWLQRLLLFVAKSVILYTYIWNRVYFYVDFLDIYWLWGSFSPLPVYCVEQLPSGDWM